MKKAIKLSEYVNTGTSKDDAQAVERFWAASKILESSVATNN